VGVLGPRISAREWPVSGGGRVSVLISGRKTWRTRGGGVWAVVGVAEGTGRPFLSPTTGGGRR